MDEGECREHKSNGSFLILVEPPIEYDFEIRQGASMNQRASSFSIGGRQRRMLVRP